MSGKNRRAVDKTPLNTPCNTTVLSSIRLNGDCAYTVYQEGTTAERFAEYLKTSCCRRFQKQTLSLWIICVPIMQKW